uniref:Uncharacterized protein n=1 Tax=Haemonchus contortus TaxID=6289 RepID=A0A7I4Z5E4_HAECO
MMMECSECEEIANHRARDSVYSTGNSNVYDYRNILTVHWRSTRVKTDSLIEEERRKVLRITPAAPAASTDEMYVMQDLSQLPSTSQEPPRHRIATLSRHQ